MKFLLLFVLIASFGASNALLADIGRFLIHLDNILCPLLQATQGVLKTVPTLENGAVNGAQQTGAEAIKAVKAAVNGLLTDAQGLAQKKNLGQFVANIAKNLKPAINDAAAAATDAANTGVAAVKNAAKTVTALTNKAPAVVKDTIQDVGNALAAPTAAPAAKSKSASGPKK